MNSQVFEIFQGDAKTMYLRIDNDTCCGDGGPVDLTECTQILVNLPNADGTFTTLKLSLSQVTITTPAVLGRFQVPITSGVSAVLNTGLLQSFNVTFVLPSETFTVQFAGALSVYEAT